MSALKFIAAGVIVALFGGFLLAGILATRQDGEVPPAAVTESSSPVTTEELLSGMDTVEVEPGCYRVLNDGVRDLAISVVGPGYSVEVGPEGSVWLASEVGGPGVFRLGDESRSAIPATPIRWRRPSGSLRTARSGSSPATPTTVGASSRSMARAGRSRPTRPSTWRDWPSDPMARCG